MHLSATAIGKFSCPYAYWLYYHKKIRPAEVNEDFTVGTGYHKTMQMLAEGSDPEAIRQYVADKYATDKPDIYARILSGFDARVAYTDRPQPEGEVHAEYRFELPYGEHVVVGVFDLVSITDDCVTITEYKSSGSKFGDDLYWRRARRSRQLSLYYWAARQLWPGKTIEIFYDVWHKSGFRRSQLTIKDTAEFLATGKYCGFDLEIPSEDQREMKGKNKNQLFETPDMLYARLYQCYIESPAFERRFIPRLGTDSGRVEKNLDKLIQVLEFMEANDCWFQNEDMCTNFSGCEYAPLCDNYLDPDVDELPDTLVRKDIE